jgi:hypothetical protein
MTEMYIAVNEILIEKIPGRITGAWQNLEISAH